MKKINYTTVELLLSDGFVKWYQQADKEEVQAWDEWIAANPKHQLLANEAVQVLLLFREAKENKISKQEIRAATNRLTDTIWNMEKRLLKPGKKFKNRMSFTIDCLIASLV